MLALFCIFFHIFSLFCVPVGHSGHWLDNWKIKCPYLDSTLLYCASFASNLWVRYPQRIWFCKANFAILFHEWKNTVLCFFVLLFVCLVAWLLVCLFVCLLVCLFLRSCEESIFLPLVMPSTLMYIGSRLKHARLWSLHSETTLCCYRKVSLL
jgi:hypothetical protein